MKSKIIKSFAGIVVLLMFAVIMPTGSFAGGFDIKMQNIKFVPDSAQIKVGDTVTWTNEDSFAHTITGFGVDQTVNGGGTFSHTFNETGTFDYKCSIHSGMTGTIVVNNSDSGASEAVTTTILSQPVDPMNIAEVVSNDITDVNNATANALIDQAIEQILKGTNSDTQDEIVQSMQNIADDVAKEITIINLGMEKNPSPDQKLLHKIELLKELLAKLRAKVIIKYEKLGARIKAEANLAKLYEIRWGNLSGNRAKCTGITLKDLRDSLAKGEVPAQCDESADKIQYQGTISVDRGELDVIKEVLFDKEDKVTDPNGTSISFNSTITNHWDGLIVQYTPPKTDTTSTPLNITIKIGNLNQTFAADDAIGQHPIGNNNNLIQIRDLAQIAPGLTADLQKNLMQNKLNLQDTIVDIKNKLDYIRLLKDVGDSADQLENILDYAGQYNFDGGSAANIQSAVENVDQQIGLDTSADDLKADANTLKNKIEELKITAKDMKFAENMIPFKDTDSDQWFTGYVSAVKEHGIISGYKDSAGNDLGEFRPANNVTVAEILKIGLETAGKGKDENGTPVLAGAANHWAKAYVAKAEELGLDLVKGDVSLDRPATRSEVVQMILEALGIKPDPVSTTDFSDVQPVQTNDTGAAAYIEYAKKIGIVSGDTGKTTFRPNDPINRAEVAKIANQVIDILLGGVTSASSAQ
jgi:plastocyanin